MDFGNEKSLAAYFFTGLLATVANSELDPLMCLVELRKRIDGEIDAELDRWTQELDDDNE
jgi:hypothetical protein